MMNSEENAIVLGQTVYMTGGGKIVSHPVQHNSIPIGIAIETVRNHRDDVFVIVADEHGFATKFQLDPYAKAKVEEPDQHLEVYEKRSIQL